MNPCPRARTLFREMSERGIGCYARPAKMPDGLKMRPATLDDLPGLAKLEEAIYSPEERDEISTHADRIRKFPGGSFVLTQGKEIVGHFFSEMWKVQDFHQAPEKLKVNQPIDMRHDGHGTLTYLISLGVHPKLQGQGAGRALMEQGLAAVRTNYGIKDETLVVTKSNAVALNLYAKSGFKPQGEWEGFYTDAPYKPVVLMSRRAGAESKPV